MTLSTFPFPFRFLFHSNFLRRPVAHIQLYINDNLKAQCLICTILYNLKVNLVPVSICMVVNIPWQIMERFGEIRIIVRSGLGLWLALGLRLKWLW